MSWGAWWLMPASLPSWLAPSAQDVELYNMLAVGQIRRVVHTVARALLRRDSLSYCSSSPERCSYKKKIPSQGCSPFQRSSCPVQNWRQAPSRIGGRGNLVHFHPYLGAKCPAFSPHKPSCRQWCSVLVVISGTVTLTPLKFGHSGGLNPGLQHHSRWNFPNARKSKFSARTFVVNLHVGPGRSTEARRTMVHTALTCLVARGDSRPSCMLSHGVEAVPSGPVVNPSLREVHVTPAHLQNALCGSLMCSSLVAAACPPLSTFHTSSSVACAGRLTELRGSWPCGTNSISALHFHRARRCTHRCKGPATQPMPCSSIGQVEAGALPFSLAPADSLLPLPCFHPLKAAPCVQGL